MKRKWKENFSPKYVLAILSFLCIVLIIVSYKFSSQIAPVKTFAGEVFTPMQKGINKVGSWIHDKSELLASVEELTAENKKLKEQLANVSYDNKILQQDKYELSTLRNLFRLDQKYASYPKVGARVIGREPNNWNSSITIDKGSDDGLAVDMNVLAGDGLVGIITEVGHNYSKVRLITDDVNNVSSMILKTGDICNVKGNLKLIDSGLIDIEMVNKDAKVEEGYEVVTSNISTKYLQGILVGYIQDIAVDSSNLSQSGHIRPAVDFDSLDTVLVITELKEKQR